jgi:RNA polymerase sigma-70 factor, ECF subfamily
VPERLDVRRVARAMPLTTATTVGLGSVTDERIRQLIEQGDAAGATQLILQAYGVEVLGYLMTLVKDESAASDAFADACESVLKNVLKFRGESSTRTWFYAIVRHAAYHEVRSQRRRRGDRLSGLQEVLVAPVRTATAAFQRTAVKDEVSRLRDALSDDERELLLLRVDRRLSWNEIAQVRLGQPSAEELTREAARCRKQFERAKTHLRRLAQEAGLLDKGDG